MVQVYALGYMAKAIRLIFFVSAAAAAAAECVKQIVGLRENSHTTCSVIIPSLCYCYSYDCCCHLYNAFFPPSLSHPRMSTINDKAVSIQPSTTFVNVCALRITYLSVSAYWWNVSFSTLCLSVSLCVSLSVCKARRLREGWYGDGVRWKIASKVPVGRFDGYQYINLSSDAIRVHTPIYTHSSSIHTSTARATTTTTTKPYAYA